MSGNQQPLATSEPTGEPTPTDDGRENEPDPASDERTTGSAGDGRATGPMPADLRSPRAKLVYLAVHRHAPVSADELRSGLRMSRLALYPILGELVRRGHLARRGQRYAPAARAEP